MDELNHFMGHKIVCSLISKLKTMKNYILIASLITLVSCNEAPTQKEVTVENTVTNDSVDVQELLKVRCLICHGAGESHDDLLAPPMRGVKRHYIDKYPEKEEFVEAIVKWNENPNSSHAVMTGAVERFEAMPDLQYPENEVRAIAAFIYENEQPKPKWMKGNHSGHGKNHDH